MKCKIAFTDFWIGFDPQEHFLYKILQDNFDVVLVEAEENPDILIYSIFGDQNLFIDAKIRVYYTGENDVPDFNKCDYAISFQHINFGCRHLRLPLYATYDSFQKLRTQYFKEGASNREFCSFVVSNGHCCDPIRNEFFEKLSRYKKVSSGGRYANNIGGPVADKHKFLRNFKFNIAFENSMVDGYTTEKIVDAFLGRTVPIYWGNPRVGLDFPKECYVNVLDFKTVSEVIEYIIRIDKDDELYSMFFKKNPLEGNEFLEWETLYIDFFRNIIENGQIHRTKHGYYGIRLERERVKERLFRLTTVKDHLVRFERLEKLKAKIFDR